MIVPSPTLFRYISRNFTVNCVSLIGILLCVIYVFDVVELMRRASKVEGVPFESILALGLLKLPEAGQVMLPFAVMFAAIYTCWRLTKTQEIVVMRAAGLSAWQFLAPMVVSAALLGVFTTAAVNPISAVLLGRYDQREAEVLQTDASQLTIARTGIWLRQPLSLSADTDGGGPRGGYALIRAESFDESEWRLGNVTVFAFDGDDQFIERLESPVAYLRDGYWEFRDASQYRSDGGSRFEVKHIATSLTASKIEESFSAPETVSFWQIPEYVNIMEETGFPTTRLEIHFQSLLAKPLLFAALIMMAATFSLRPPRFGGTGMLIALGVLAGFFIFFVESMLQAFGLSQKIPVFMAAWTPALLALLLGVAALLHTEDG
jgi:lipopolysaccharide export system permease protein